MHVTLSCVHCCTDRNANARPYADAERNSPTAGDAVRADLTDLGWMAELSIG